jgi:hypothetical protein
MEFKMTERIVAWQCIGCGRIEGAQPCVGICEDRRAEFVHSADYDAVLDRLTLAHRRCEDLETLVRQIAHTTPRKDEYERAWRALQDRARAVLGTMPDTDQVRRA